MLSPAEFFDFYAQVGAKKARNSTVKLFLAAVLAGFFIGGGGLVSSIASFGLTNTSVARVVSGLLFPFGLIMVIVTGAELFTGNCLITVSLLEKKATLAGMVRKLAAAAAFSGTFDYLALGVYAIRVAANKCAIPFGRAVVLGILCNILVCAGVMCSLCSKSLPGRAIGAFVPVCFFVIGGFEHCVANMYYIPAGLLAAGLPDCAGLAQEAGVNLSSLSMAGFFSNLIPVTIGNIIGGCGFGALIWACQKSE